MAVDFKAQCAVWTDSISPKDACLINPTFRATGPTWDPQTTCDAINNAVKSYAPLSCMVQTKLYDLAGTKPVYPMATTVANAGQAAASTTNREIALCLSFYSVQNIPRKRGRLYVPYHWQTGGSSVLPRPAAGTMTIVGSLAAALAGIGGVDIDWTVWSERDQQSHPVTDWWVDNEWDVVRSRGLLSTTRIKGTTTENNAPNMVLLDAAAAPPSESDLELVAGLKSGWSAEGDDDKAA